MARPFPVPSYRLHKPTGLAVTTIRLAGGVRRDVYLGKYNSDESRREYAKLVAELATAATVEQVIRVPAEVTIDEVILAFWRHAEKHYRRADGSTTQELVEYKQSFKPLRELYGPTRATEFGPIGLKAIRQKMVDAKLKRSTVNNRIRRLKHVFKWAVAEELVPPSTYQALAAVAGLQRGRSEVSEADPVEPVAVEHVLATLVHLPRQVAGMVEFEFYTGCRPGEVCAIRPVAVDKTGAVWTYRPLQHKTAWRGKPRIVAIGPRAQKLLAEFAPADPADYYFSPQRTVAEFHAERGESRVTPLYPSHARRNAAKRKSRPVRSPAPAYTPGSYARAVARAVDALNAAYIEAAVEVELHVPQWSPNRLRHTHGTEVRRRFGLEHAGAALGHSKMSATEVYAARDAGLAVEVALAMG